MTFAALLALTGLPASNVATSSSVTDVKKDRRTDFGVGKRTPMSAAEKIKHNEDLAYLATLEGDVLEHEDELAARGLYIVSDTSEIAPAATNSDMVAMGTPYVTFDVHQQRYFAVAKYQWKASADSEYFDAPCNSADNPCNVGGPDGFGMRFNRNVTNLGVGANFCGRPNPGRTWATFGCTSPSNPDDNSSAGVSWRLQDRVYKTVVNPDYNMHNGVTSMGISGIPCGVTLQAYGRYGHSWSTTSLTGFSVSTSGFGLSWAGGTQHWGATSQGMAWTRC